MSEPGYLKPLIHEHGGDYVKLMERVSIDKELFYYDEGTVLEMISGPFRDNQKFEDTSKTTEEIYIDKWNFVSYSGFLIKKPYLTILYEGKYIRFRDVYEVHDFLMFRFQEREQDRCPICGEMKGRHLRMCFATGSGLPYEIFVCSKECLRELTHHIMEYNILFDELKHLPKHGDIPYHNLD